MERKYILHTLDNLTDLAQHYFMVDRIEDARQLLNTATTIFYSYDDKKDDFSQRLSNIHELAEKIIHQETSRFESNLTSKFTCFR